MTEKSEEELARLDLIRRRMAPARAGRGPRLAGGILIAVLLVVITIALVTLRPVG